MLYNQVKTNSIPQGVDPVNGERDNPVPRAQDVEKSIIGIV